MSALARLAAAGSAPLGAPLRADDGDIPEILRPLARVKNGFYAFESALHVYPWGETGEGGASLRDRELWRREYGDEVAGLTFFAEDAFGFQFATDGEAILFFDPETAEREHMAADVEEWAAAVLDDVATYTGFPVMHEWQARNGTISPGHRLAPAIPFVLGGGYDAREMRMAESIHLMRFRADLYRQIKGLPDGARIRLRVEW